MKTYIGGVDLTRKDSLWAGYTFSHASEIDVRRDSNGQPMFEYPHMRYDNPRRLSLVPHGDGPHVRLVVERLPEAPGAYVIANDALEPLYVGIATKSLRQRWGPVNYAVISPRNCYRGGQSTNVRVNYLIGHAISSGERLGLWIHETDNPTPVETAVYRELHPRWTLRAGS